MIAVLFMIDSDGILDELDETLQETIQTVVNRVKSDTENLCSVRGLLASGERAERFARWFDPDISDSHLVGHAKRELQLIGEDPETIQGYLRVVQSFADMGHSGGSASVAIPTIRCLLGYGHLAPIDDDLEHWAEVEEGLWQSKRNPKLFSDTRGATYYDVTDPERKIHDSVTSEKSMLPLFPEEEDEVE